MDPIEFRLTDPLTETLQFGDALVRRGKALGQSPHQSRRRARTAHAVLDGSKSHSL